jgi:outer membrane protein, heavy metal efflux system
MVTIKKPIICGFVILSMAACGSFKRGLGFDEVKELTAERSGKEIIWYHDQGSDDLVRAKVENFFIDTLTLDEVIQVALLNNPGLQGTYERLGVAQAEMVEAGLLRNPVFDAEARFGSEGTGLEVAVVQSFLSIFYLPLRKQIGAADFEAAKFEVTRAVLDFVGRTRSAFYELQAAMEECKLWRKILAAADASFQLAKRMHEAGNITDLDFDNERAFYEQTKLNFASLEIAVLKRRERLNVLMGLWGKNAAKWKIRARLPDIPQAELAGDNFESIVVEKSLDLMLARSKIEIAAARLHISQPLAVFDESEAGASSEKEPGGTWTGGPAVTLPIPLFSQGQAAAGRALAEFRRDEANYRNLAVQIRAEARTALATSMAARDRVEYQRKVLLPLRSRIVQETQKHYNAMLVGAFQLLQAKQSEINSGVDYVREVHQYWQARNDVQQLLSGVSTTLRTETLATSEIREQSNEPNHEE